MEDAFSIILTNGYSTYTNTNRQYSTSNDDHEQYPRTSDFRRRHFNRQNNDTERRPQIQNFNSQQYISNPNNNTDFQNRNYLNRQNYNTQQNYSSQQRLGNNSNTNCTEPMDFTVQSRQTNTFNNRSISNNRRGAYRGVFTPSQQTRQTRQSYQVYHETPMDIHTNNRTDSTQNFHRDGLSSYPI